MSLSVRIVSWQEGGLDRRIR